MGRKNKQSGFVYSTDPDYEWDDDEAVESIANNEQRLTVQTDKKNRKGKIVTLILGFEGPDDERKTLAKSLKQLCGTGGSDNADEILVQGDFKQKIHQYLLDKGFSNTKLR